MAYAPPSLPNCTVVHRTGHGNHSSPFPVIPALGSLASSPATTWQKQAVHDARNTLTQHDTATSVKWPVCSLSVWRLQLNSSCYVRDSMAVRATPARPKWAMSRSRTYRELRGDLPHSRFALYDVLGRLGLRLRSCNRRWARDGVGEFSLLLARVRSDDISRTGIGRGSGKSSETVAVNSPEY
jgi:hypothetical protein